MEEKLGNGANMLNNPLQDTSDSISHSNFSWLKDLPQLSDLLLSNPLAASIFPGGPGPRIYDA